MKLKKYLVEYNSNNSGGRWWLEKKQWLALEKAGWRIYGSGNFVYTKAGEYEMDDEGLPIKKGKLVQWLGGYAHNAIKRFDNITKALQEFEKLTGADISDEGCNCCGAPHSFSWEAGKERGYCSGESCLEYLYPGKEIPKSLREALTT